MLRWVFSETFVRPFITSASPVCLTTHQVYYGCSSKSHVSLEKHEQTGIVVSFLYFCFSYLSWVFPINIADKKDCIRAV